MGLPLKEALLEFKRAYIARALADAGGNQTRAAERLGLQRTFLNRLLKELGLREGAGGADESEAAAEAELPDTSS